MQNISLSGNSRAIASGDTTTTTDDGTDFGPTARDGSTVVQTFAIANSGELNLALSGSSAITISGENAGDFSITAQPSALIGGGNTSAFNITFDPNDVGIRTATIKVASNDSDETPFTFDVLGEGLPDVFEQAPPRPEITIGNFVDTPVSIVTTSLVAGSGQFTIANTTTSSPKITGITFSDNPSFFTARANAYSGSEE